MKRSSALAGGSLLALVVSVSVGTSLTSAQAPEPSCRIMDLSAKVVTPGVLMGEVWAINDAGHVGGSLQLRDANGAYLYHAFVYRNDAVEDLGCPPGQVGCQARGLDDRGRVVGRSYRYESGTTVERAFLHENGVMTDITPTGATQSFANDVNDAGDIVGTAAVSVG
jgi:probable HAF family extracellular repeat protein